MPNPGIHKQDLPGAVRECIEAKEMSRAYLVELQDTQKKRHGNLFLDIFGFNRKTHESGWRFKGLILIDNDLVVYKLSSGEPQISREEKQVQAARAIARARQLHHAHRHQCKLLVVT